MFGIKKHHIKLKKVALILAMAAIAVFLFSVVLMVNIIMNLSKHGFPNPPLQHLHQKQITTDNIRDWMTFRYINRFFNLPSEYLKINLNITDKKYPDITISKWAKDSKQDSAALIEKIKTLIDDYQFAPPQSPTDFQ